MADTISLSSQLLGEKLLSFSQAARLIPSSRQSRPVSPSCLWRWHRFGVKTADGRSVRLEAVWLVNRLVTTEQAVQRFIAAQQPDAATFSAPSGSIPNLRTRSADRRQRESERALRDLQDMRK